MPSQELWYNPIIHPLHDTQIQQTFQISKPWIDTNDWIRRMHCPIHPLIDIFLPKQAFTWKFWDGTLQMKTYTLLDKRDVLCIQQHMGLVLPLGSNAVSGCHMRKQYRIQTLSANTAKPSPTIQPSLPTRPNPLRQHNQILFDNTTLFDNRHFQQCQASGTL
jgi:hypothetical protein